MSIFLSQDRATAYAECRESIAKPGLGLIHQVSLLLGLTGWRQTSHNRRRIKRLFRRVQRERVRDRKSDTCLRATEECIVESKNLLVDAWNAVSELDGETVEQIRYFVETGEKQIDQISRRCFNDEVIPHSEKVFSLFESHTEWISKGKAGVPQELGLRVAVMESTDGFILHHRVMEHENDAQIGHLMVAETKTLYPELKSCSMDKGFWEPEGFKKMSKILDSCVIPKKGRLNAEEQQRESSPEFRAPRQEHAAVESGITALEQHGLDRCPDHGIDGFRRYVGLAVVARNLQVLGRKLQQAELEKVRRKYKPKK